MRYRGQQTKKTKTQAAKNKMPRRDFHIIDDAIQFKALRYMLIRTKIIITK